MASEKSVVVYLYPLSPFGRKVTDYLALRGIPHSVVNQPPFPPRPDLDALDIHYRRIPIISVGSDIYCDTRIIFAKLEQLFPVSSGYVSIGAANGTPKALEQLLEIWSTDSVFQKSVWTLPPDLMTDPTFAKDRSEIWGGEWGPERQKALRPGGLQCLAENFTFLETLMSDGKKFVQGNDGPTLADIHALFIFDWLLELFPGTIPDSFTSKFPKTFSWLERYHAAIKAASTCLGEIPVLTGDDAAKRILSAEFAEQQCTIDTDDPVAQAYQLKEGDMIEVWPEDILTGYKHREIGKLVALTVNEVAVSFVPKSGEGGKELRVHFPRWNYKIQKVDA